MTEPPAPGELRRLTSLRWYAALLVFGYHADRMIGWRPLRVASFGQTGVAFFFVLSGFVLTWSMRPGTARAFYRRRFARIYPSMAVMLLVTVAIVALWPQTIFIRGRLGLVADALAIQAWFPGTYPVFSYNSVAWSLSVEALFYALFPWLARALARWPARTQVAVAASGLAAAVIVAFALYRAGHGEDIAYTNPLIRLPEFVLGIVLALRIRAGWRPPVPVWVAVLIVAAAGAVAREVPSSAMKNYMMVLPFAVLIVAGATADLRGVPGFLTHHWSLYLGRLSFAFYLVHQIVLASILQAADWWHGWSLPSGVVPVVVTFTAACAAAVVLHHLVEKPFDKRIRQGRTPMRSGGAAHRGREAERKPA